ncbi:MAG: hypothetical protein ED557_03775 [Balneola sp.]|nr:MAG: hypothetical protein ED557_03775 [Balneola sp.]
MSKFFLSTIILAFVYSSAFAQEFKPKEGDWGAEVNFTPFSSSPININYIKIREFAKANKAIRFGLFIGAEFENTEVGDEDVKNQTIELNLRPGYEFHYPGTERLSPYVGIEADLAIKLSKSVTGEGETEQELDGAWNLFGNERGFYRFGVNGLAGVDFYISPRLYLGTEFGFGFEYIQQSKIELTAGDTTISEEDGGSSFQLGPNVNGAIRLGFNF